MTEEVANAITVPEQAMKKTDKTKQVFVLNQGLVEKRNVTAGLQVGSIQQIEKEMAQGEYVSGSPVQLSGQRKVSLRYAAQKNKKTGQRHVQRHGNRRSEIVRKRSSVL